MPGVTSVPGTAIFKSACLCIIPLILLVQAWLSKVSSMVPGPYLDEVFHIPQAQTYCNGHFRDYDPKLTTPPGLYAASYALHKLFGFACDTRGLRFVNASLWSLPIVYSLLYILSSNADTLKSDTLTSDTSRSRESLTPRQNALQSSRISIVHTACNIFLFPPLFFFFALYYTDIGSTALVLVTFSISRLRNPSSPRPLDDLLVILCGTCALTFRQTNIFWVAVFPAAMDAFQVLKTSASAAVSKNPLGIENSLRDVIELSWKGQVIYDPPVDEADLGDYLVMALSMTVAATANIRLVLRAILPYGVLLCLFTAFILWNRGVVLGDKSNHVATLHVPQMLYIWAYFMFFSFPIIVPHIMGTVLHAAYVPKFLQQYRSPRTHLPRAITFAILTALATVAVRFNTIVHPFTLSDNRHYVFYVFRILRLYPVLRYLATPVYILCGWAVLQSLAVPANHQGKAATAASPGSTSPISPKTVTPPPREQSLGKLATKAGFQLFRSPGTSSAGKDAGATASWPDGRRRQKEKDDEEGSGESRTASFAFVWVLSCTLNLITAPLVEPRYFILPWIFWRLYVPLPLPQQGATRWTVPPLNPVSVPAGVATKQRSIVVPAPNPIMTRIRYYYTKSGLGTLFSSSMVPLIVETAWFLLVNALTGYIFLYWGFEWPQEPGVVQRFLY